MKYLAILVLGFLTASVAHASSADAPRAARESAVLQARDGNPKAGLLALQYLLSTYPDDPRLLADSIVVANWAGEDALALDLYFRQRTPKDDPGVIEAAARSARNLHLYDRALGLYQYDEAVLPERWQARLGQALVLTDQESFDAASSLLQPLIQNHPQEADVLAANIYLCNRQKDLACVLATQQRLANIKPGDSTIQCQIAETLSGLGAETLALGHCPNSGQERRLQAAAAAEGVRWSEAYGPAHLQTPQTARALADLENVIAGSTIKDDVWRQAQFDRLVALSDLHRTREVVQAYEKLLQEKLLVPPYALKVAANAYLALREPERAEDLFRELVHNSPQDAEALSSLAYAQLEQEHIGKAFHTVDDAYANSPAWLVAPDLKGPKINSSHSHFGLQAAKMRGYVGLLAEEQSRLTKLLELAPADIEIRRQLAITYLDRGWPSRAFEEEKIADTYAQADEIPSLESAEINEAAGRRDAVDAVLPILAQRDGQAPALMKFLRDRAIERGWQFRVQGDSAWSSGSYIGTSDQHNEAHLYSPFLRNRWQIFGHGVFDNGDFTQGKATRVRSGAGITYNYERQSVWGEVAADTGTAGTKVAGSIGGDFAFGDHWLLRTKADSDNVEDIPLIATLGGVRARGADLNLGWHASELRAANIGAQRLLFTDGNQRLAITGRWDEHVRTSPRLGVSVAPSLWASTNSKDTNRLYFNPKSDFSLGPQVTFDWLTWRRYERSLNQEIGAYAAPYWQHGYGTGTAGSASYTIRWKPIKRFGFFCGVKWNSQPYDGSNESYTALNYGLILGSQ
jgi:biofilm PGA synthesis protein PgaA